MTTLTITRDDEYLWVETDRNDPQFVTCPTFHVSRGEMLAFGDGTVLGFDMRADYLSARPHGSYWRARWLVNGSAKAVIRPGDSCDIATLTGDFSDKMQIIQVGDWSTLRSRS